MEASERILGLVFQGAADEAFAEVEGYAGPSHVKSRLLAEIAWLYFTQDNVERASELADRVLGEIPHLQKMLLARAVGNERRGETEAAFKDYKLGFELRSDRQEAAMPLADYYRSSGDDAAAEAVEAMLAHYEAARIDTLPKWREPSRAGQIETQSSRKEYLDLLEKTVANWIYGGPALTDMGGTRDYNFDLRQNGRDIPMFGHSMIGLTRLRHLRWAAESVIHENIPGDFIETGVWRGGACILLRGVLSAYNDTSRRVYVADSFKGLPPPSERYDEDVLTEFNFHQRDELSVDLESVRDNFRKYDLLDDQVVFVEGWFHETLPGLTHRNFAILRVDGDLYSSTMDALEALDPSVAPGGFVIIDDYGVVFDAERATLDFREKHGISEPMTAIDGDGIFWRKHK